MLQIVMGTGLLGLLIKLYKPTESNMLFDGASAVLYVVAIAVYISNIVKGLRIVSEGVYGEGMEGTVVKGHTVTKEELVGREDSLKVMAASDTILALVLVGVLVLQAGQWYANDKEAREIAEMDAVQEKKRLAREGGKSGNAVSEGIKGGAGVGGGEGKKRK